MPYSVVHFEGGRHAVFWKWRIFAQMPIYITTSNILQQFIRNQIWMDLVVNY